MKKLTSVIAITLLAALLLTACDFIPMKKDFSNYGFTFTIAGKVTEKEGNEFGNATLYTKVGDLTFQQITGIMAMGGAATLAEASASLNGGTVQTLENGASFFSLPAKTDPFASVKISVVEAYYFIQFGNAVWQITCKAEESEYDEDALLKVLTSATFVAEKG